MTRLDETLAATSDGMDSTAKGQLVAALSRGTLVGRYVALDRIGSGAMGVVYVAYDPELDRKVALKLLHGRVESGSDGRTGLLAEAQALAKLRHPNVVAVHDVGTVDEHVWIAMEFVEGRTLTSWLAEQPRRWREVLDTIAPAARGLAAVHAAGLVHRDVKPDNVMVAADGSVRVMDFGLARAHERLSSDPADADGAEADPSWPSKTAVVGTPAYMAPEQLAGRDVGASADQFSFCVLLWEALYGERPFSGETLMSLAIGVIRGQRRPPPRASDVPAWLRRILERGLDVVPQRRFASMDALIVELERGQGRARVRRGLVALGVAGLVGTAGLAVHRIDVRRRIVACEADGSSITAVWNDEARRRLHAALIATSVSYAEQTVERLTPWVDARAEAWRAARTQACVDTEVHATWDARTLERATWCLDERRVEIEVLLDELVHADATVVQRAIDAAARLPLVEPCRDAEQLARMPEPPVEGRERVREVQAELARAEGLERIGRYEAASATAGSARAHAEELAWSPLVAVALVREASVLARLGEFERAEAIATRAYFEAAAVDAWQTAAAAATSLVALVGTRRARPAEGLLWAQHAQTALQHAGDPTGLREAALLNDMASAHRTAGDLPKAQAAYVRALSIRERVLGAEHPDVAATLNNLANTHWAAAEYVEARALHERALAATEQALGSAHPSVGASLNNLGNVYFDMGELDTARSLHERALAILENAHGPDHPDVATGLNNLANVHLSSGSHAKAVDLYERALAISQRALGPEHPDVAMSLTNLAVAKKSAGDPAQARVLYERALAIDEKVLGPDHPDVASTLVNLGNMYREAGDYSRARVMYERALAIDEKALGAAHPEVAACLTHLALLTLDGNDATTALPLAERAVAIFASHEGEQRTELLAEVTLGRALMATSGDRRRALPLVEHALAAMRAAGETSEGDLAQTEAWLAKHRE